jgi:hypothetical protein
MAQGHVGRDAPFEAKGHTYDFRLHVVQVRRFDVEGEQVRCAQQIQPPLQVFPPGDRFVFALDVREW